MKIKKGDTVEIIAGKDAGKRGEVVKALPQVNKVVVQALNQHRRHQKARPTSGGRQTAPEIVLFDAPLAVSNVMLVCPKCSELTRVGYQREVNQAKRICRKCQALVDA